MIKRIHYWYSSLPLASKITLLVALLITLLAFSFSFFSISLFNEAYSYETEQIARQRLELFAQNLNQDLTAINNQVIDTSTMPLFVRTIQRALNSPTKDLDALVVFQQFFKKIADGSPLIHSVHAITRDGVIYSPYEQTLRIPFEAFAYSSLNKYQQITLLPSTQNPFAPSLKSVPIVVSLNLLGSSSYLELSTSQEADIFLLILLDEQSLLTKINTPRSSFFSYTNSLSFQDQALLPTASDPLEVIRFTAPTSLRDLDLVMEIDKKTYKPLATTMIVITVVASILVIAVGSALISKLAQHITAPFDAMTSMIKRMEAGAYTFDLKPKYADETGTLIEGMNSMYKTIIQQMNHIKVEEEEKYRYLSQMLTEQINPHFIYNTLEIINMEIINGHQEQASAMIGAFASFLRYTLNRGKDTTTIAQELEQCRLYLSIMNTRQGLNILLINDIPSHLMSLVIPKSILLPLVENSIRHGFTAADQLSFEPPVITISAEVANDRYTLEVCDNGSGIDIDQAKKALNEHSAQSGHIGLYNVYNRLKLYFADVEVNLASIPGFRNTITFTFSIDPDRSTPQRIATLSK